jgi:hypothetical protein
MRSARNGRTHVRLTSIRDVESRAPNVSFNCEAHA